MQGSLPRRVLVTQSYFLRFDPKLWEGGRPVPPTGSLIFAALLRERGFDVRFFDAMLADSEEQCGAAMDLESPDAVVIFEDNFNYLSKMCLERMRQAAVRIMELAGARGIPLAIAGAASSDEPEFFLKAGAFAVALGEGEHSVAEWLEAERGAACSIPGLVTLDAVGRCVDGGPRPNIRDLDSLPPPAWDLIDIERYRVLWKPHGRFELPLATSRGCPFHCNWCAKPIWGQRYNVMSPSRAAADVGALRQLGATHVNFLDDILGLKPEWLEQFATALATGGGPLPFRCLSRADLLNESRVAALSRAGCEMVWIGAESGSQKVLDAMEKGTTLAQIRDAAHKLKAAGILVGLFVQFGYPGETREDIEATLALIDELAPDDIGISVSYPLPGTPFHERVKHEIGRAAHWQDSADLAMLFKGQHGTRYYRRLHAYTHARFRMARALRVADTGPFRRVLRWSRHAVTRVFTGAALALAERERVEVSSLPAPLSRESAATPSVDARASGIKES